MLRRKTVRLLAAALAGWALVAAQATAFEHDLDLESHPTDQVCAICVATAGLGGANVGSSLLLSLSTAAPELPDYQLAALPRELRKGHLARAPPRVS